MLSNVPSCLYFVFVHLTWLYRMWCFSFLFIFLSFLWFWWTPSVGEISKPLRRFFCSWSRLHAFSALTLLLGHSQNATAFYCCLATVSTSALHDFPLLCVNTNSPNSRGGWSSEVVPETPETSRRREKHENVGEDMI